MVKLRMRRVGKKKQPSYRLVAAYSRSPRDGRFIETLGFYNPLTEPPTISFNEEKVLEWLKKGAQPTEIVQKLLYRCGIWEKFKPEEPPAVAALKKKMERKKAARELESAKEAEVTREVESAAAAVPDEEVKQEESPSQEETPIESAS